MTSRTLRRALPALILAALLPGLARAWIVYTNMDDLFLINFPREPEVRNYEHISEYGAPLPAREYFVEEDNGTRVSLTVIDFNDALPLYEEIADKTDDTNVRSMWIYDQRGSIAYEAAKLRAQASEILYDGWHHIDRVEGLNLVLGNADASTTYAGLYLHARRLYLLNATVPEGGIPQGLFQQSLAFLDETGDQIRYWMTPEGKLFREH